MAGFSPRTVLWVAAVAAASFAVALILMAYGPELAQEETAGPSAFSSSALGHRALLEFLEESGIDVRLQRGRRLFQCGPGVPVVLAEPDPKQTPGTLQAYLGGLFRRASRRSASVVIVLPKWSGTWYPVRGSLWVHAVRLLRREDVQEILDNAHDAGLGLARVLRLGVQLRSALACDTAWGERVSTELIAPQLIEGSSLEPVVWTEAGVLVGRARCQEDGPTVYLVSDPDLLNNHGLARRDNSVVVLRTLADALQANAVVLDEVVHGWGRDVPFLAELLRFPLVLTVVHGALVFGCVLWTGMARSGKPRAAPSRVLPGKLSLIENTARLLSHRSHVADSAARYFQETLVHVARRLYLPGELEKDEVLASLQELSKKRGSKVDLAKLRGRLASVRGSRQGSREEAVAIAKRIHAWRKEMLDER